MEETRTVESSERAVMADLAGKYLTFLLADEEYGLEIMKVQEIIGMMPITKVPRVPEYVRGVINLRGRIIPTVELRAKFGMKPKFGLRANRTMNPIGALRATLDLKPSLQMRAIF